MTLAALVTFNDLTQALAVPGAFLALHLLEGQLVQPLTVGHRLSVNALVILLAIWFGYWFWGVPGVMLAVPSLVALKVAAEHEPSWLMVRNFLAPNTAWTPKGLARMQRVEATKNRAATGPAAHDAAAGRTA